MAVEPEKSEDIMCRGEFKLFSLSQKFEDLSPWRLFKENRGLLSRRNFWLGQIAIAWTQRHEPLPSASYLSFLMLLPVCVRGQFNLLSSQKHYYEKDSGGDRIPAELFQILKDDAVKMLHSICQQIWKTQQWKTKTGKGQFSFQFQRKAMPKNVQILHNCMHLTH